LLYPRLPLDEFRRSLTPTPFVNYNCGAKSLQENDFGTSYDAPRAGG